MTIEELLEKPYWLILLQLVRTLAASEGLYVWKGTES